MNLSNIRPDTAAFIECGLAMICIAAVIYIIASFAIGAREQIKAARAIGERQSLPPVRPLPNISANRLTAATCSAQGTQPPHSGCGLGSACLGHRDCADTHCPGRSEP